MVSHNGLYAYGLIGKHSLHSPVVGIDKKQNVYVLAWKDLSVLVSKVDIEQFQSQIKEAIAELTQETKSPSSEATDVLESHEEIIDTIMQDYTVVPFKFGTILKSENAALQMLQENEEHFRTLLGKFTGKVEWGVKVYADRQALIKHIEQKRPLPVQEGEKVEKHSRGAAYLLGKKKEEDLKKATVTQFAHIAQDIFHVFAKDAFEAKVTSTPSQKGTRKEQEIILNAVYLIEKESVTPFLQHEEALREKYAFAGVNIMLSGPWPPYNFT